MQPNRRREPRGTGPKLQADGNSLYEKRKQYETGASHQMSRNKLGGTRGTKERKKNDKVTRKGGTAMKKPKEI